MSTPPHDRGEDHIDPANLENHPSKEMGRLKEMMERQHELFSSFIEQQTSINQTLINAVITSTPKVAKPQEDNKDSRNPNKLEPRVIIKSNVLLNAGQSRIPISVHDASNSSNFVEESSGNVSFSGGEVKRLLFSMSGDGTPKIKIPKPEFSGNNLSNPIVFLKDFEQYCRVYKYNDSDFLIIVKLA